MYISSFPEKIGYWIFNKKPCIWGTKNRENGILFNFNVGEFEKADYEIIIHKALLFKFIGSHDKRILLLQTQYFYLIFSLLSVNLISVWY